jgi:hypothetical protein
MRCTGVSCVSSRFENKKKTQLNQQNKSKSEEKDKGNYKGKKGK